MLKQTFKKFEIIIIYDDDSKEDLNFVKKIKKLDKRIKLYINKRNLGAGPSRNFGISKSTGSYICFIDADDIWSKNKLKDQIRFMKENKILVSHTSYKIKNNDDRIIGYRKAKKIKNYKQLLRSCDIGLSTVIIKKNILKNNLKFAKLKTKEDYVLWLNLVKKGYTIHSLNKNLTTWTKVPDSLSSSVLQKLKDSFAVYYRYMHFGIISSIYKTFILSLNFLMKNYKSA